MSESTALGLPNHLLIWSGITIISSCVIFAIIRELDRNSTFEFQTSDASNNKAEILARPSSKFVFPELKRSLPNPYTMAGSIYTDVLKDKKNYGIV